MPRQFIPCLDKELQLNTINEIKELFGEEFLTKGRDLKNHQLKILWNRADYLSTAELYLIGHSIKHNKHNIVWIEDFKSKIIRNKVGSIRGFVYESFISSIIKDSILAEPSQESYDLKIKNSEDLSINLSIKKMILSDKEIEYKKGFDKLEIYYKEILKVNKLNGISLFIEAAEYDYDEIHNLINALPEVLDKYGYFYINYVNFVKDNINVTISKIQPNYELYEDELSYQFNLIIPIENVEKTRFMKKLKKSIEKFKELDLKENELNSILIGLSPSQSIYDAKKILEKELNKGLFKSDDGFYEVPLIENDNIDINDKYRNILFIVLAKHLPVIDKKDNSTFIRHEFALVYNMKYAKHIKSYNPFFIPIELGSNAMIMSENDESYLSIDNLKIKNCYSFQSICKHEFIEDFKVDVNYDLSNIGQYKENTISFIKDGNIITVTPFTYGEYNNLLIL